MTRSEVLQLRALIERSAQALPDEAAVKGVRLHPAWEVGAVYEVGFRVCHGNRLFKAIQGHTAQIGWEPDNAASLWMEVCEVHSGSADDPIPYEGNMALTAGLYYSQDGMVYRGVRGTEIAVHQPLKELVGLYVEKA
jgi:hypothetical protein